MESGDPELEAVIDERFGRSNLGSPSSQEFVPTQGPTVKGRFSGRIPRPIREIIGDDGIQRKGEFETEEIAAEIIGNAPHQLDTPVTEQRPPAAPKVGSNGK